MQIAIGFTSAGYCSFEVYGGFPSFQPSRENHFSSAELAPDSGSEQVQQSSELEDRVK